MDKPASGYYGPEAYNSEHLPQQKRPAPGANPAQPWFNQKADRKLPWGHTEDVAPSLTGQIIPQRHSEVSRRNRIISLTLISISALTTSAIAMRRRH